MNCIDCQTEMDKHVLDGVLLDQCPDCEGIWLDGGELDELVGGSGKQEGILLLEARKELTKERRRSAVKSLCPRCQAAPLSRHVMHGITLDRCGKCKGLWFDHGELQKVRSGEEANASVLGQLSRMLFGN